MKMAKKILFFVLIAFKEFTSGIETDSSEEHETDITIPLNEAIIKTFQCVNPISAMKLVSYMESRNGMFDFQNAQRIPPFSNQIFFHGINISIWEPELTPKIYCEFLRNKTHIFNSELIFKVVGFIDTASGKAHASFKTNAKFKDIAITGTESSTDSSYNKFRIDFTYNHINNYVNIPWYLKEMPRNRQDKLIKKIRTIIPSMIRDNINSNEKFVQALRSSFCSNPKQQIISTYPDFPLNEQKYYYFIPTVSLMGVNLIDIKIKGLSNFESLKPNTTFGGSVYTLVVKSIRGSMKLDNKELQNFKYYEMEFNIDYLYITADFENRRLVVEARDYNVTHNSSKSSRPPKVSIFSDTIMQNIETAICSQLMPSLEIPDTNDLNGIFTPHHLESSPIASEGATETSTNSNSATARVTTETLPFSDSTTDDKKSSIATQKLKLTQGWYTESTAETRRLNYERLYEETRAPYRTLMRRIITLTSLKTGRRTTTQESDPTTQSSPSSISSQADSTARTTSSSITADRTSHSSTAQDTRSSAKQTVTDTSQNLDTNILPTANEAAIEPATNTEGDDFDYDIAFHNVTVKLIPGTPYPKQIQCGFDNTLKIDHQINAIPSGNLRLSNKGNSINIRFHVNFTAIKISVIKPNSSQGNESCEFEIHNNQDIKVVVPSAKNTSKSITDMRIKNKIENTLISMVKERITQSLKPLVCLPFDFCSQSIQMVDNFFLGFVDNVLKKCSLRRNTTTTST